MRGEGAGWICQFARALSRFSDVDRLRSFEIRDSPVDGMCSDFVPKLTIAYPILSHQRSENQIDNLITRKGAHT